MELFFLIFSEKERERPNRCLQRQRNANFHNRMTAFFKKNVFIFFFTATNVFAVTQKNSWEIFNELRQVRLICLTCFRFYDLSQLVSMLLKIIFFVCRICQLLIRCWKLKTCKIISEALFAR